MSKSTSLTPTQLRVLSYGLNFIPSITPSYNFRSNFTQLQNYFQQFKRNLSLHYHYNYLPNINNYSFSNFIPISNNNNNNNKNNNNNNNNSSNSISTNTKKQKVDTITTSTGASVTITTTSASKSINTIKTTTINPIDKTFKVPNPTYKPPPLPPYLSIQLDTYIQKLLDDVSNPQLLQHAENQLQMNLSIKERQAILQLKSNPNIVIKPADKNLGPTILDKSWYLEEANRQLSDSTVYTKVNQVPFDHIHSRLQQIIKNTPPSTGLSNNESSFLLHPFTTEETHKKNIPHFYLTPKIHKQPLKGRPIVANHSWCLKNVAVYLDRKLQPIVKKLPNVLDNTLPLLRLLSQSKFPPHVNLVTADVSSLYTNIPHDLGLTAVKTTLLAAGTPSCQVDLLLQLLELVLTNNYFEFHGDYYHQISGTAMGSQMAPCYANIVMHYIEKDWYTKHRRQILLYRRYLDDLFIVMNTGNEQASQVIENFNNIHPKIQVTATYSNQSANFLDLTIYKGPLFYSSKMLDTKCYSKTYAQFLYLPFKSYHPRSTKIAMVKGEAIRLLRNSSNSNAFNAALQQLKKHLKVRGYPDSFVTDSLKEVNFNSRPLYLKPKEQRMSTREKENKEKVETINLKLPYSWSRILEPKQLINFCEQSLGCQLHTVWMPPARLSKDLVTSRCE